VEPSPILSRLRAVQARRSAAESLNGSSPAGVHIGPKAGRLRDPAWRSVHQGRGDDAASTPLNSTQRLLPATVLVARDTW